MCLGARCGFSERTWEAKRGVVVNEREQTAELHVLEQAMPERGARPELASDYLAPRNELERQLVQLWEETLCVEPIGVRDDFYELGGNSQLATRLFAQIERSVGASLPWVTLQPQPR